MEGDLWLSYPMELHSSREDSCSLTPEQCAYRSGHWRYWYRSDLVYAIGTTSFIIALILVFTPALFLRRIAPTKLRRSRAWNALQGVFRFASYKHFSVNFGPARMRRWESTSLGVLVLLGVGFVFFMAMTLGPRPYYWPNTPTTHWGNSPPLATRSGWMALACLPFILILPTKANMIAALTGVSHERLVVFHSGLGWAMLVLALTHTFPFIVYNASTGTLVEQWRTSVFWWTGVAALVPQAYLQVMSLPWIRNAFYEFFKATHYLAALLFVLFLFFHCDWTLTSWDYFIAAGVLYTLHFLYPLVRTLFEHGTHRATVTLLSPQTMKITIPTASTTRWDAGQHLFLRFLAFGPHALTAHPFTIASYPSINSNDASKPSKSTLVFYVTPRGGITAHLAKAAATGPVTIPVLLDGPYGGVKGRSLRAYDSALVIACGAGAGISLAWAMEALVHAAREKAVDEEQKGTEAGNHRLRIVMAARDEMLVRWYADALVEFATDNGLDVGMLEDTVDISVYITTTSTITTTTPTSKPSETELDRDPTTTTLTKQPTPSSITTPLPLRIRTFSGRPDLAALVRTTTTAQENENTSVGIAVCGPAGVLRVVREEAAAAQLCILRGGGGPREVYLHSELFSW